MRAQQLYQGPERRRARIEYLRARFILSISVLILSAAAFGSLAYSFKALQMTEAFQAALIAAEVRGAVNRILTCEQTRDLQSILRSVGKKSKPEPLCDDLAIQRYRALVSQNK